MYNRLLQLPAQQSLFLFGPRNTGKSTLIKSVYPDAFLIDLLDNETEDRFVKNPKELQYIVNALPSDQSHVIIDEVQKIPRILDTIHQLIESTDKKFILTGSSARKIKGGASNLLAGRAFVYHLFPFCFLELGQDFDLTKSLNFGMLPKIYNYNETQSSIEFLKAYTHTYLKEEIWLEQFIRKLEPFRKFLEIAAQMNGQIINFRKIASEVGVDEKTIKQYFGILEDTLVGFFLEGFQNSVRKRLLAAPKFYFFDVGVTRALTRVLSVPIQKGTSQYGYTFEHFIILECRKLASYMRKDFQFSYYKTKDGVEIDLVVERPAKPILFIEIKSKTNVSESDLKELKFLKKDFTNGEFVCFSNDPHKKIIDGITIYPWQEGIKNYFGE